MLQLSLDPGINAVFQFQHGRQRKLHLCVTRRGAFPAWCVWSTHVQSRVFSRPDPRAAETSQEGGKKRQEQIKEKSSALRRSCCLGSCKQTADRRRLLCICSSSPPCSAERCEGRGDSHRCYWFQATPLFNTPRPLYDATVTPPPTQWLYLANFCIELHLLSLKMYPLICSDTC